MTKKAAPKPETKPQKRAIERPAPPTRRAPSHPYPPRPSRGPGAPAATRPADEPVASELDLALEREIEESTRLDAAYPMFPHLSAGAIDRVEVFRKVKKPEGGKGTKWVPITLPWQADTLTWRLIREICGGGDMAVRATKNGRIVASSQEGDEGPPRVPTTADAARLSFGGEGKGEAAIETPGGWISFPGVDPAINVAFVSFQQIAWMAREDANKANAAVATLLSQVAEHAFKPDPGYALLQEIMSGQRDKIDTLYTELRQLREEHFKVKIEQASSGDDESKMRMKLYEKGIDIMDGAAGAAAMKLLGNNATGNSAADLGKLVANRILDRNAKQLAAKGAEGGGAK